MTPEQLGMEDEDIIDVFVTKPSEGNKRGRDDDAGVSHSKRGLEDSSLSLLKYSNLHFVNSDKFYRHKSFLQNLT